MKKWVSYSRTQLKHAANSLPGVQVQQELYSFCEKQSILYIKISYYKVKHLRDTFSSASGNTYFTNFEGPPLYKAALSLILSSSPFPTRKQLFSSLSWLLLHETLNVFPGSKSGYPKTSSLESQWWKLLSASLSSHSNPSHPPQTCWRAPFIYFPSFLFLISC